jgi:hypothetical protein
MNPYRNGKIARLSRLTRARMDDGGSHQIQPIRPGRSAVAIFNRTVYIPVFQTAANASSPLRRLPVTANWGSPPSKISHLAT